MKRVLTYLLLLLVGYTWVLTVVLRNALVPWLAFHEVAILSAIAGGVGGIVYQSRAVYLNACVKRNWDDVWLPWYFVRPAVSLICGLVAYVFLRAGLIALDATPLPNGQHWGFLAFSFIAGYNVDKFTAKLESLAQATWGIDKTRVGKESEGEVKK